MKQENIKDIKKALECCIKNETEITCQYCKDCPAFDEEWVYEEGIEQCDIDLWRKTLALINELESENDDYYERATILRRENEQQKTLVSSLENQIIELKDRIAELENIGLNENITVGEYLREMQRLKDRVAKLEKEIEENAFYSKGYAQGIKNTYEVVIPDKLKQFAEKEIEELKSKVNADNVDCFVECKKILEETLKEFVE